MIDLHSHTLLSDGELLVSELVRRAEAAGYRVINISDHADLSNLDFLVPRVVKACAALTRLTSVKVIAGVEITHCPLEQIAPLVEEARKLGAQLVTVHGETLSEPVVPGTNRAAIEAGADILAHPGLIREEDVVLAAQKDVHLEISARKGHCLANGHVAGLARAAGAKLVFGTDCHAPEDLVTRKYAGRILRAAGLDDDEVDTVWKNGEALVKRVLGGS
ncbi:MAG TPA: histidinol phosphate phosphatase domain-containing protein [Planctomycetota bacterium]|nr:histidinol phosphate phosphatase domain-containing protein [Planctomycetota bacterium]